MHAWTPTHSQMMEAFTRIRARERFTLFFLASELEARPELRGISAGLKAIASVGIGIVAIVICCLLSYFN